MLHPRDIGPAISRLRGGSLLLFDRLTDEQLELEALPGWTVADVFRHLADSDRGAVLGGHLLEFLPGKDLDEFERHNDANLARLRERDRATLRHELEVWGRRLSRVVGLVPGPVARVPVPTSFGRLPMGWVACLRLYDEWVHRWDVARASTTPSRPWTCPCTTCWPSSSSERCRPARCTSCVGTRRGDPWSTGRSGASTSPGTGSAPTCGRPTATVRVDVPALCLVAGDRVPWRELAAGPDRRGRRRRGAAAAVLDACRVV